jgi:hypothetical protein
LHPECSSSALQQPATRAKKSRHAKRRSSRPAEAAWRRFGAIAVQAIPQD